MRAAVLLLALGAVTYAVPVKRESKAQIENTQCASRCSGIHSKYRYVKGKSYEYTLQSSTDVEIPSHAAHNTNITQNGKLWISVHSDCEFEMKIESLQASGKVPAHFAQEMTARPVRFAFDDGRIERICADREEPTWVLNVKRGILTALHNAWEADQLAVDEEDIAGTCKSTYDSSKHGDNLHYSRHKHSCKGHHNIHGAVRATQYEQKSLSPDASHGQHECTHKVNKAGLLTEASCVESQSFEPFGKEDGGVIRSTTRISIKLDKAVKDASPAMQFNEHKSMHFDASEMDFEVKEGSKSAADKTLKKLCETSDLYVVKETPSLFIALVQSLRQMAESDITGLVDSKGDCDKYSQFLQDALPMCGTEQCVAAMVHVLKSKTLSNTNKQAYFTSLAFVPKASLKMVESVVAIVDTDAGHVRGLLGVSSLVHTYCVQHENCEDDAPVKAFVAKLTAKLGASCGTDGSGQQVEHMVIALKALGNMGHGDKVLSCAKAHANPVEVRVAAVQSLRRLPCDHKERETLTHLFKNMEEDVELRIFSFLSLVKCPSSELLDQLNTQLENEQVNQVGSFVWSYLKTRRSSSDPTHRVMSNLLRTHGISRRFERDPRQYSRFYEMGSFSPKANSGAHMEQGVIFVPGSYTPRHVYANMSIHLFGHSVNFFEFGARAEGLDHLYDGMIGPEGVLQRPNAAVFGDEATNEDNDYEQLEEDFQKRPHYESRDRLALSAYMRVFGDELAYAGLDDPQVMDTIKRNTDFKVISDFLAKQQQMNIHKNLMFIDLKKALPSCGLPLRLSITGVASLNVEASGKIDVTKTFKQPHDLEVHSAMTPSAAVEIATSLSIHIAGEESGLRLLSRMHTTTAINHDISIKNGQVITFKMGVPQDQMKVVDFEIDVVSVVQGEQVTITEPKHFKESRVCSPEIMNTVTGFETCWGYRRPAEKAHQFPRRAWVEMEKKDEGLESYELTMKMEKSPMPYPQLISFNTPGSNIDRLVSMEVQRSESKLDIDVKVPGHTAKLAFPIAESLGHNEYAQKVLLTLDEKDNYEFDGKVSRSIVDGMSRTELHAVANRPDGDDIEMDAHLAYRGLSKFDSKLSLTGLDDQPFVVSGIVQLPSRNDLNAIVKLEHECKEMKALLDVEGKSASKHNYMLKFANELTSKTGKFEPFNARFTVDKKMAQGRQHVKLDLVKSMHPQSNFEMDVKADHSKVDATLKYGNQLTGEAKFDAERVTNGKKHTILSNILIPEVHIDHNIEAVFENDFPHNVQSRLTVTSKGSDKLELQANMQRKLQPTYHLTAEATAKRTGSMDYFFKKEVKESSAGNYDSKTIIQWAPEKQAKIDAKLTINHPKAGEFNYVVDADATVSGVSDPIKLHKTVKVTEKHYKWAAILNRGGSPVYDVNLEVDNVSANKRTFKSHAKSHYVSTGDFDLTGDLETKGANRHLNMDVKKNGKQYAKLATVTPGKVSADFINEQKEVKVHSEWNMDSKPSEVMFEYKLTHPSSHAREHKLNGHSKINGGSEYKWSSTIRKNGDYTMNNTLHVDGKEAATASWGVTTGSDGYYHKQVDMQLKTSAPYAVQDKSALLIVTAAKGKSHAHADITCHVTKNKALLDVTGSHAGHLTDIDVKLEAGQNWRLNIEEKQNRATKIHLSKLNAQWAPDKKIVASRKIIYKGLTDGGEVLFEESVTTPFEALSSYDVKVERKVNPTRSAYGVFFKLNDEERLNGNFERLGPKDQKANGWNFNLKTANADLGEVVGKLDRSPLVENSLELENLLAEMTWGKDKKIHLHGAYGCDIEDKQCKYTAKWEANLTPQQQIKARMLYTKDGHKHAGEVETKRNNDAYMLSTEYDDLALDGTVKVSTPHQELKTASIKLKKNDNNEYVVSTQRNGADGPQVEGTLKPTDKGHKVHLTVNNIDTPVMVEGEFDASASNRHVKLIFTPKYNTDDATPYGVEVLKTNDKAAFTIVTPERRPHLQIRRPSADVVEVGAQLDRDGRGPTKVQLTRRSESSPNEIQLSDPALTQPLKLQVDYLPSNKCPQGGEGANCRTEQVKAAIVYSDKEDHKLWTTLGSSWRTDGDHHQMAFATIDHPVSHYHQRYFVETQYSPSLARAQLGVDVLRQPKAQTYAFETKVMDGRVPEMKLTCPSGIRSVKYEKEGEEHRLLVLSEDDKQPSYVAAAQGKDGRYQVELRKGGSQHVLAHVSDKLVDKNTIVSKMYHVNGDVKHEDVYVKLWLEEEHVLKLRMHVSPSSWRNLIESIVETPIDTNPEDNPITDILQSHVEGLSAYNTEVQKRVDPLIDAWKEERDGLTDDVGMSFAQMYDILIDYYEMVNELVMAHVDTAQQSLEKYTASITDGSSFTNVYKDTENNVKAVVKSLLEQMSQVYEAILEAVNQSAVHIKSSTDSVQDYFDKNEQFSQVATAVQSFVETLKSITSYEELRKTVNKWMDDVKSEVSDYESVWDTIMDYSILRGLHMIVQPALDELMTYDVREIVNSVLDYAQDTVDPNKFTQILPKVNLYEPEKGQVEIQVPLPIKADSLLDLFNKVEPTAVRQYLRKTQEQLTKLVSTNAQISDEQWRRTGAVKPISLSGDLDGAHYSIGYIMGDRHVITFDGTVISLASECEYLLAQDFISNKFTLSAKFSKVSGKTEVASITTKIRGLTIVMSRDGDVTVDKTKVELPFQKMDDFEGEAIVKLLRLDHGVQLTTFDGVKIELDFYHRQCMVRLPTRYHGHSNGLLGSNDNEAANDLHLADGASNTDEAKFADQWVLGNKCKAKAATPNATPAQTTDCDAIFRSHSSSLSTCFRRVAPRAYHTMCLYDKCNATAAYVRACSLAGSHAAQPAECVQCDDVNMKQDEEKTVQSPGGSDALDIVFVVEERPCLQFAQELIISEIANKITAKLTGDLKAAVRYGVVGFGGEEVHNAPHVHTGGYAINFDAKGLKSAVDSLNFKSDFNNAAWQDPLAAVDYASTQYAFRPMAAKAVVLLTCSACGEQVNYYDVQQRMIEKNIQLHVYTTKEVLISDGDNVEPIGFSANELYTSNRGAQEQLRESLQSPHDSCTVLAQELNGTVWSMTNEESSEFTVPSERIAQAINAQAKLNACQVCQCDAVDSAPRTQCQPCDVLQPASLSSTSFFNNPLIALGKWGKEAANEPVFMI